MVLGIFDVDLSAMVFPCWTDLWCSICGVFALAIGVGIHHPKYSCEASIAAELHL